MVAAKYFDENRMIMQLSTYVSIQNVKFLLNAKTWVTLVIKGIDQG